MKLALLAMADLTIDRIPGLAELRQQPVADPLNLFNLASQIKKPAFQKFERQEQSQP